MATYNTDSKEIILNYLSQKEGEHLTINDIYVHFKASGVNIGQTTIYRRMEDLVKLGIVKKYTVDSKSAACFEFVGKSANLKHQYHFKCEKCGKLIHFKCDEAEKLWEHLTKEHNFQINLQRTVIYGICDECRKQ